MVQVNRLPLETSILFASDRVLVGHEFCSHSLACTRDGQVNALHRVSNNLAPLLTIDAHPSYFVGKRRPILGAFSFAGPSWLHRWLFNGLASCKVRAFLSWHRSRLSGGA